MAHTLLDMFYHWERKFPDKVWLNQPLGENQWKSLTWKEAGIQARKIALALKELGLSDNAKVAILSKNCDAWVISDIAIQMAGYISVPIFGTMAKDSIDHVMNHAEVECILVGQADNLDVAIASVPEKMPALAFDVEQYNKFNNGSRQCLLFNSIIEGNEYIKEDRAVKPDDVITIIYTSGTTGLPKGVVHTQSSFLSVGRSVVEGCDTNENTVLFSYLPLAHIAERGVVLIHSLTCGGEVYFNQNLETFLDDLKYARPTWFLAVPRIWTKLQLGIISKIGQDKLNSLMVDPASAEQTRIMVQQGFGLDRAEYLATGSAPLSTAIHEWFENMGMPLNDMYGMTESIPATLNNKANRKVGTLGKAAPGAELKISEEGEILFKTQGCMVGYYKDPEKTSEALVDGWMHSGDKGEIDSEGFLKITGRLKELYKTSKGKYVAPAPIEGKVARNSYFEMLCLMGAGMPSSVMVAVLSETGTQAGSNQLRDELPEFFHKINEQLDAHERMSHVLIVKDLWTIENGLLTHTMKLKRNDLETKYLPIIEKIIDNDNFVAFEDEVELLAEC